jgi:hypothetical protein
MALFGSFIRPQEPLSIKMNQMRFVVLYPDLGFPGNLADILGEIPASKKGGHIQ